MVELKGIENIEMVLNSFLEQFECHAELGTEFSYIDSTNTITYTFVTGEESNIEFEKFIEREFPHISCNIFLWSLLHELGHHETIDDWTEEEQASFDKEKDRLEKLIDKGNNGEIHQKYFSIPDEYAASAWAAEFLEINEEKLHVFWDALQKEILTFYLINGVENM